MLGKNSGTGVGLVEVYDLEPTTGRHLANTSTRAFVNTGENVLIAGFIVEGDANSNVVVRAIGPTLGAPPYNVSGPLPDPVLQLHDTNGELLEANDNWGDSPEAAAISAAGYAPPNSLESAILFVPAPGNFTALVRGAGGGTGVALVEVYRLGP